VAVENVADLHGGRVGEQEEGAKAVNPAIQVVGADPEGSVFSGGAAQPYLTEGVGEDFWPATYDTDVCDRIVRVSDRDAFLTARQATAAEGILVGESGGTALWAALQVARSVEDPAALLVVLLPDSGRNYLGKLYNDEWMRENQMLDSPRITLSYVLGGKDSESGAPAVVSVAPAASVRQALGLMALHDVSQLPVMDGTNCVGSVSDWSLSQKSLENAQLLELAVSEVMDAPFPVVTSEQPVDSVVKLLSKSNPAVLVLDDGEVQGIITRSDMLDFVMSR